MYVMLLVSVESRKLRRGSFFPYMSIVFCSMPDLAVVKLDGRRSQVLTRAIKEVDHFSSFLTDGRMSEFCLRSEASYA